MRNLRVLGFEDFSELTFPGDASSNPVLVGDLWHAPGEVFLAGRDPEEALVYRRGGWYHCLATCQDALAALLANLPAEEEPRFAALPEAQWALVRQRWPELHVHEHLVLEYEPEEGEARNPAALRSLAQTDVSFLLEHQPYIDEYGGEGYLRYRIRCGPTAGSEIDGALVAWEIFQDDGTLGFLRVLAPYRGRGVARALHHHLALRLRALGKRALAHVSIHNRRVLRLAEQGGTRVHGRVAWVRRRSLEEIRRLETGEL
jgi:ribosomal protein S18 acetylase RimI-like enzyme